MWESINTYKVLQPSRPNHSHTAASSKHPGLAEPVFLPDQSQGETCLWPEVGLFQSSFLKVSLWLSYGLRDSWDNASWDTVLLAFHSFTTWYLKSAGLIYLTTYHKMAGTYLLCFSFSISDFFSLGCYQFLSWILRLSHKTTTTPSAHALTPSTHIDNMKCLLEHTGNSAILESCVMHPKGKAGSGLQIP